MIKKFLSFLYFTYLLHPQSLFAQGSVDDDFFKEEFSFPNQRIIPCATPDPTIDQIIESKAEVDEWLMQNGNRNRNQVVVYVIWHVIYASDGTGNISDNRIIAQIEAMNQEFPGPMKVMKWIEDEVSKALKRGKTELTWTTPSGFRVTQRLMKPNCKYIHLRLLGKCKVWANLGDSDQVDLMHPNKHGIKLIAKKITPTLYNIIKKLDKNN